MLLSNINGVEICGISQDMVYLGHGVDLFLGLLFFFLRFLCIDLQSGCSNLNFHQQ